MALQTVIPLVVIFVSGVWAQATCGVGYSWNKNSLGQDPCEFGSMLDASCRGLSVYPYPSLTFDEYYVAPQTTHTGDLTCDCNTVMYSIYMACSACQGGEVYSWTEWIAQCQTVYVSQYPVAIAQGTAIPYWAYYDITSLPSETYDDTVAESVGQDPEQFPVTTTSHLPHSTGNSNSSGGGGGSSSNTPIIIGVCVGVVVIIKIILITLFWRWRIRRRQRMVQTAQQVINGMMNDKPQQVDAYHVPPLNMSHPTPPPMPMSPPPMSIHSPSMVMPPQQQMYPPPMPMSPTHTGSIYTPPTSAGALPQYNPEDPSTYPSQSPPQSMAYTTAPDRRGAYNGIPEI